MGLGTSSKIYNGAGKVMFDVIYDIVNTCGSVKGNNDGMTRCHRISQTCVADTTKTCTLIASSVPCHCSASIRVVLHNMEGFQHTGCPLSEGDDLLNDCDFLYKAPL